MTREGDLVLVYMEGNPIFFARIEKISPDPKPDWWQVKLLVLQVPLMVVTGILREAYINGEEFTMGGRPMRLVKVEAPPEEDSSVPESQEPAPHSGPSSGPSEAREESTAAEKRAGGKVVSLLDRKKRRD